MGKPKKPTVIHSYTNFPSAPGLGDFLRGSLTLYYLSKKYNFNFAIDFHNHLLGNFLITKYIKKPTEVLNYCNDGNLYEVVKNLKVGKPLYVVTNNHLVLNYTKEEGIDHKREYVKQFFRFKKDFAIKVEKRINELGFKLKEYNCLVLRLGDLAFNNDTVIEKSLTKKLDKLYDSGDLKDCIVLCENNKVKEILKKKYGLYNLGTAPEHPGRTDDINKIEDVAIDLFTLVNSKKNLSTNTTFTESFSELYNIPYSWIGWTAWY